MKRAAAFLMILLAPCILRAQSLDAELASAAGLADSLRIIYAHLEYPSEAFDDLKETWIITDPLFIRDIVNRLGAGGGILRNGAPLQGSEMKTLLKELYDGRMRILVRRRAFDDELESLELFGSSVTTDPVSDWVYLSEVLAEPADIYREVKSKRYSHIEVTRAETESARFLGCDILLHASRAEMLLWTNHPAAGAPGSEYRLSLIGLMGNEELNLPFWYTSSIVAGLRLDYRDDLRILDRTYEKFTLFAGPVIPVNFSVPLADPAGSNPLIRPRILQSSGGGVYLKGTWVPRYGWPDAGQFIQLGLETSLSLSEKERYASDIPPTFYSIRNSLTASAFWKHAEGIFDLGLGASWHDLVHYRQITPPDRHLTTVEPTESHYLPFIQAGISGDGPLVQFSVSTRLNCDLTDRFAFFVVKSMITLNSAFGIDIQYYKALNTDRLPPWHYDSYLLVSPLIRINY